MGPIERELRSWDAPVDAERGAFVFAASSEAYCVYFHAWVGLGARVFAHPQSDDNWPDIMSEAIEAASELGL